MKILSITLIRTSGTDVIYLHTDLPNPIWPFTDRAGLQAEAAASHGEKWVLEHFPGVPLEIINVRKSS